MPSQVFAVKPALTALTWAQQAWKQAIKLEFSQGAHIERKAQSDQSHSEA